MVHANPDIKSKVTRLINPGEYMDEEKYNLHNEAEWIWTRGIKRGHFVVLIVSTRSCLIYHCDSIGKNPNISEDQLSQLKMRIHAWFSKNANRGELYKLLNGRAFVICPLYNASAASNKADQVANEFCHKYLANLEMVPNYPGTVAEFLSFEGNGPKAAVALDPESHTVEVSNRENENTTIWINGVKQRYDAMKPSDIEFD